VAISSRIRGVSQAAGTASAATPYVSRLMTDKALRFSVKDVLRSADRLYNELSSDGRPRKFAEVTHSRVSRTARIIRGLGLTAAGLSVAALLYPRTRRGLARIMGESRDRATKTVHDTREKVSGTIGEAREKVSRTVHNVSERVSGRGGEAGEIASEALDDASEKASETANDLRRAV
jgi:hypothetical protein